VLRIMGVRVSRAPCGALALLALVLLLCHAFVLPVVSRPIREGRELLSESDDASEVSVSTYARVMLLDSEPRPCSWSESFRRWLLESRALIIHVQAKSSSRALLIHVKEVTSSRAEVLEGL
jgi:hypothetical protein